MAENVEETQDIVEDIMKTENRLEKEIEDEDSDFEEETYEETEAEESDDEWTQEDDTTDSDKDWEDDETILYSPDDEDYDQNIQAYWAELDRFETENPLGAFMTQYTLSESDYSEDQWKEILEGARDGDSYEAVTIYAYPDLSAEQIKVLRESLKKLPAEDVRKFADPELTPDEMREQENFYIRHEERVSKAEEISKRIHPEEETKEMERDLDESTQ